MGSVVGEKLTRAIELAIDKHVPVIIVLGLRRRPHAGGHPVADADGQDLGGAGAAGRGRAAVHLGPHRSDHRRRDRELRHAGRRHPGRAARAHRLRRAARHRRDDPPAAARGLPALGVPARARPDRPHRRAARAQGHPSPPPRLLRGPARRRPHDVRRGAGAAPRPARRRARRDAPRASSGSRRCWRRWATPSRATRWPRSAAPTARARWPRCWPPSSGPTAGASVSTPRRTSCRFASASASNGEAIAEDARGGRHGGARHAGGAAGRQRVRGDHRAGARPLRPRAGGRRRARGGTGRPLRCHHRRAPGGDRAHAHRPRSPGSARQHRGRDRAATRRTSSAPASPSPPRRRPSGRADPRARHAGQGSAAGGRPRPGGHRCERAAWTASRWTARARTSGWTG